MLDIITRAGSFVVSNMAGREIDLSMLSLTALGLLGGDTGLPCALNSISIVISIVCIVTLLTVML